MAVYKVIQDVEAEDKLLGPLTFKGFLYAIIAGVSGFICFRIILIGSPVKWVILPIFLLPMLLFGLLASPLGRDQPTEVWLLAKIRFFIKPRIRIWNQSGIQELVTITAPKRIEQILTKNMSQNEVHSRLKTLASTLDTRGWAIKNVDLNLNTALPGGAVVVNPSDRLVANAGYTQTASVIDIHAADDIMDEQNNPTAQKFAALMQTEDEKRKRNVLETMKGLINDSGISDSQETPNYSDKENQFTKAKADFKKKHSHTKKRDEPKVVAVATKPLPPKPAPTPVTPERQAVNMELAQSGSAFSVATLSQLANREPRIEQTGPNEVTISLH